MGQLDIHLDKIRLVGLQKIQSRKSVSHPVHCAAKCTLEDGLEVLAAQFIVFDKQDELGLVHRVNVAVHRGNCTDSCISCQPAKGVLNAASATRAQAVVALGGSAAATVFHRLRSSPSLPHLRRMKRLYAGRRETVMQHLRAASRSIRLEAAAGPAVMLLLPDTASDVDIARRALPFGIAPAPLSPWYIQSPARQGFLLGVSNVDERRLQEDCRRLVELIP